MASILMVLALAAGVAQETTSKDFTALHAELCKKEKWETVAWRTDLHESRAASMKEGKPIFIWAMDGQTLGCT